MGVELAAQRYEQIPVMDEEVNISDRKAVDFVKEALIAVKSGNSKDYKQLVKSMHDCKHFIPEEAALLSTCLQVLSAAASYIDGTYHGHFLILQLQMQKNVDTCLAMLVRNVAPPMYMIDMLKQVRGQATKEQVLSRIHKALEDIINLVPMTALRFQSIFYHGMLMTFKEHHEKDCLEYRTEYMKNMLRLDSGAIREFLGRTMLMAVVDVLIVLDVDIGSDDVLREGSSKGIFLMELEDEDETADDDGDVDYDGDLARTISQKSLGKNVIANLLDHLMVQIFEHLESCANEHHWSEVFLTLLSSFKMTILNAQFVMFYACALDPENCGVEFAKILGDMFTTGDNPVTRMNAVAYLASYLARGKFLPAGLVTSILERLVDWCVEHCMACGDLNREAARIFYSCCQAFMYVLRFHMRSIMDNSLLKSQLFLMPFEAIFKHKLEPMKVCLPSIIEEFLKQANAAHLFPLSENETFIFDDTLESDISRDFGRLDMFFPFDPCLLKTCDRNFIGPNFLYWKDVRTPYGIDEEDSSDEEIAEGFEILNGGEFMEDGMEWSYNQHELDRDEFDNGMNEISIRTQNGLYYRFGVEQMQMPAKIRPATSPVSLL